ncbi:hypothetical protein [Methylopila sp. M107]|uniref:hypothetical protein n=1 Tax=Methylopila sp. M107 TaxID=1101190 RepID=UPI0003780545|nr:hypothetical protein [Methylopila sp. M107]
MKTLAYALGALAIAATAAQAEPVTRSTITGYAASVAVARGIPTDGSVAVADHQAPQFRQSAIQTTSAKRVVRTDRAYRD